MASMTSSLVGQRLVVKANKAVRARNVQVKAMASKPKVITKAADESQICLLYTSPSPRDRG